MSVILLCSLGLKGKTKRHISTLGPRTWDIPLYGIPCPFLHDIPQREVYIPHDAGTDRLTLDAPLRLKVLQDDRDKCIAGEKSLYHLK